MYVCRYAFCIVCVCVRVCLRASVCMYVGVCLCACACFYMSVDQSVVSVGSLGFHPIIFYE